MPRPTFKLTLDCSDAEKKARAVREFAAFVGKATGVYEFDGEPKKNTRSLQQNKWYWGVIVQLFYEFLRDQDYEITSPDAAHGFIAAKLLREELINPATGEVIGRRIRSTTELSTAEFSDYCERARAWLADFFGIVCPDPDPAWSRQSREVEAGSTPARGF